MVATVSTDIGSYDAIVGDIPDQEIALQLQSEAMKMEASFGGV